MNETIPHALRIRILDTYEAGGSTQKQVAERFKVSLAFVKKLLRQKRELGHIDPLHSHAGRHRILGPEDERRLVEIHAAQSDATLEEYHERLGVDCHIVTIHRALVRLDLRFKKKSSSHRSRTAKTSASSGKSGSRGRTSRRSSSS